jgi:pyruvate dehydrogenase E1 component alpha subunit
MLNVGLQQLDKTAKQEVDVAVEEAKASPEPLDKDLWTDIYYGGTEPAYMRGREREEVCVCCSLMVLF